MIVLVVGAAVRIVDWAWPTRSAAWIDPACLALRLMAAATGPAEAEAWAARVPAWTAANLVEHLARMEHERARLRAALESIRA
jgi:hypothetical protein